MVAHRRKLEPRRLRQPRRLVRYILFALLAALVGALLVWGLNALLARYLDDPEGSSILRLAPAFVFVLTVFAVVALVFFGLRAYLQGSPGRRSFETNRARFHVHR